MFGTKGKKSETHFMKNVGNRTPYNLEGIALLSALL